MRRVELRVETARTAEELERFRAFWDRLPWQREEAEPDYLLARLGHRPGSLGPFAAVVFRGDEPVGGVVGRLEQRRLDTNVGFRTVYAPAVRVLQIVDGGIAAVEPAALPALADAVTAELSSGRADVATVPPLALGSEEHAVFAALGGPLERQRFIAPWTRRRLVLPSSFDEFLASLSRKLRFGVRYDAKKLHDALGDVTVEILRSAEDHERLVRQLDQVARSTYQFAVGAGFRDTPEQSELARIGLERGWTRAYVLTGFDPAYAKARPGIYLLMRVIEDACADSELRVLDFGPGDAAYKRQFSNESFEERNLLVYAPTLRGRRVNATRTAILGGARLARRAADATKLTDRVRARWRRRLG